REDADRGDLKLVNAALKELRYSFLVFQPYVGVPKVSIFGSARTTRTDPAYRLAHDFAQRIVEHQWMVITGAGPGIMEAGIAGAGTDHSFGVNIVLPFEQEATPLIAGDPKLINYRYFFTRKLTFMKESRAFVLLPGGFGTMDEGFELFTLMQTGRTPLVPVVLLDEPGSTYWTAWLDFVRNELGGRGLISDHDISLVRLTQDIDDAVDEICSFYSTYHSMRFVGRRLVLRLQRELTDGELAGLDRDFGDIVTSGGYQRVAASPSEVEDQDVPDLPRIAFRFDRSSYNRLRHLINRLNGRD
ncbi:MAG: LOG family protein, partial [Acidimicrobiales bacterium]